MERDGSNQQRLSANYLMDFTPSVSNDGRIIYTRWEYVDRAGLPDPEPVGDQPRRHGPGGLLRQPGDLAGHVHGRAADPRGNGVLATATNHNGPCRGGIVAIDPSKGANAPEAVRNLTPEIDIYAHRVGGGPYGNGMLDCGIRGAYEKPLPLDDDRFLVSKGGIIQIRDFDANAASLLFRRTAWASTARSRFAPQPRPPVLTGNVMDRTAQLPEDGRVTGHWATVFVQDVYIGLEPAVKRGEIKQIAVVQEIEKSTHTPQNNQRPDGPGMRNIAVFGFQFPLVSCGATYAPKKVWGLADVAPDGSAAFRCRPKCRSTSWPSTAKAARCSGCGPSRT